VQDSLHYWNTARTFFYVEIFATNHNKNEFCISLTSLSLALYFWGSGKRVLLLIAPILLNGFIGKQLVQSDAVGKKSGRALHFVVQLNLL